MGPDKKPENLDARDLIVASDLGDRMKSALRLVADGWTVREAAREIGCASHADVYRAAKRFGLLAIGRKRLGENWRSKGAPSPAWDIEGSTRAAATSASFAACLSDGKNAARTGGADPKILQQPGCV